MKRAHFIISGLVQGVCFRMSARSHAGSLGLTGWVRNNPDGSVETVAEGEESAVDAYLDWCRHGPPHARVSNVKVETSPATGEYDSFEIGY